MSENHGSENHGSIKSYTKTLKSGHDELLLTAYRTKTGASVYVKYTERDNSDNVINTKVGARKKFDNLMQAKDHVDLLVKAKVKEGWEPPKPASGLIKARPDEFGIDSIPSPRSVAAVDAGATPAARPIPEVKTSAAVPPPSKPAQPKVGQKK